MRGFPSEDANPIHRAVGSIPLDCTDVGQQTLGDCAQESKFAPSRSGPRELTSSRAKVHWERREITTRICRSCCFPIDASYCGSVSNAHRSHGRDGCPLGARIGLCALIFAVFDFRTARWVAWIGSVSTGALAAVFLLQGVSELIGNSSLTYIAFQVFGQRIEATFVDLFTFWCAAMLLIDSEGKTRILGFVALSI